MYPNIGTRKGKKLSEDGSVDEQSADPVFSGPAGKTARGRQVAKKAKVVQYRQGDVFLVRVDSVPTDAINERRRGKRLVLADGEVTGHAHAIESDTARLVTDRGGSRFLILSDTESLVHEEHATIVLEPGNYRVVRQREYVPDPVVERRSRPVRD